MKRCKIPPVKVTVTPAEKKDLKKKGYHILEYGDDKAYYENVPDIPEKEIEKALYAKACDDIAIIKNCIVFFAVLTAVNLLIAFIVWSQITTFISAIK